MSSLRSLLTTSTTAARQALPILSRPLYRTYSPSRIISQLSRLSTAACSFNRTSLMKLRARERIGDAARRAVEGITGSRAIGQVRGMKTKSSVKRLCDGCKFEESKA
ncbi:hypothetical protein FQN54_005995 [Arachnomyces sp. PD_36]|nr:hypothetical protein FQN54_005995 [Arachnomyces sp. PD_36]